MRIARVAYEPGVGGVLGALTCATAIERYTKSMYIMYVDESGDPGLTNSPGDFFVLSAIVVHERRWRDFIEQLVSFRKAIKAAYGLPVRAEIHASEFISRRLYGLDRHVRLAVLRNALDELAKIDFIRVTNVVVRKQDKDADFEVFETAWKLLFQRFENTLKYGNFPGEFRTDSGIVVTDATAGVKLLRLIRRMAVFNHIPNDSGIGSRNVPITRVIEDPHGKDSSETLPIQMCDVVAYFLFQRHQPNSFVRRKGATQYFNRIDSVLNKYASRFDAQGIVYI